MKIKTFWVAFWGALFMTNAHCLAGKNNTPPDDVSAVASKAEQGDAASQNIVGMWYYKGEHYKQSYTKAFKWWSAAAAKKYPEAFANLGMLYRHGQGVEADSVKAVKHYTKSVRYGNGEILREFEKCAEQSYDAFGAVVAAICYENGYGCNKSLDRTQHFFEIAAKVQSVDAYRELGFIYHKQRKESLSLIMFEKAASLGDNAAAYQYAKAVIKTDATEGNRHEAVFYLQKAAEAGNLQAQNDLGLLYYQGNIVTKDYQNAVKWFTKAAVAGWSLAQWNLVQCLVDGKGIERDFDQAVFWLGKAYSQRFVTQINRMCSDSEKGWNGKPFLTYLRGLSYFYSDDEEERGMAYNEFKKISKSCVEAKIMMAMCLRENRNKKADVPRAIRLLKRISRKGNALADFRLAYLYETGEGAEKKIEKAIDLYRASAEKGCALAQCYMGDLLYDGRLVEQNYAEAVKLYLLAEQQGQLTESAAFRLSRCYEKGLGGLREDKQESEKLKKKDFKNHVIPMMKKIEIPSENGRVRVKY